MQSRQKTFLILFALLVLGLLAGIFYADLQLASRDSFGQDFKVYWSGARYFLLQNTNPYSVELAAQIRREVFGIPLAGETYPHRLEYPFYILMLYLPFAWIADVNISLALWMLALELSLVAALLLSLQALEWRPSYRMLFLLLLGSLLGFFSFTALLDGNISLVLLLFFSYILFALHKGLDEAAGLVLALTTFKWEAGGLLILLILVWAVSQQRWKVVYLFGIGVAILLMLTTVLLPNWPVLYFNSVLDNLSAGKGYSTVALFAGWWPGLGNKPAWGLAIVLGIILLLEWQAVRTGDFRRLVWAAGLTLAATPLLGLPLEPANLVLLIIPTLLVVAVASERWKGILWVTPLILLTFLAAPWAFVLISSLPARALQILAVVYPLCLLGMLYWLRWWAVRPPRVWADRIRQRGGI